MEDSNTILRHRPQLITDSSFVSSRYYRKRLFSAFIHLLLQMFLSISELQINAERSVKYLKFKDAQFYADLIGNQDPECEALATIEAEIHIMCNDHLKALESFLRLRKPPANPKGMLYLIKSCQVLKRYKIFDNVMKLWDETWSNKTQNIDSTQLVVLFRKILGNRTDQDEIYAIASLFEHIGNIYLERLQHEMAGTAFRLSLMADNSSISTIESICDVLGNKIDMQSLMSDRLLTFDPLNPSNKIDDHEMGSTTNIRTFVENDPTKQNLEHVLKSYAFAYHALSKYDTRSCLHILDEFHIKMGWPIIYIFQVLLGRCYLEMAQNQNCVNVFQRIHKLYPFSIDNLQYYSTALWRLRDREMMKELVNDLKDIDPVHPITLCARGNASGLNGQKEIAISLFRKAAISEKSTFKLCTYAHLLLASEHLEMGNYREVRVHTAIVLKRDPYSYRVYYIRGIGNEFKISIRDIWVLLPYFFSTCDVITLTLVFSSVLFQ